MSAGRVLVDPDVLAGLVAVVRQLRATHARCESCVLDVPLAARASGVPRAELWDLLDSITAAGTALSAVAGLAVVPSWRLETDEDGQVDDLYAARPQDVHLERMDTSAVWVRVRAADGSDVTVWVSSESGLTVTPDVREVEP